MERLIKRTQKYADLDLSEMDDMTLPELIIYITKQHDKLEECLECGEFIKVRNFEWYEDERIEWCVYAQESDEEYQYRLEEKDKQEKLDRERDMKVLQRLSKKYPEVKIEL